MLRRVLLLALLCASASAAGAQQVSAPSLSLEEILERAGDAVTRFYARAQSIVATETVVQDELRPDLSSAGSFQRRLVYEHRMMWDSSDDGTPEARVQRELIRANNRPPRPKDKPKCFDKDSSTPDAMQMLLPVNRGDYVFKLAKPGRTDKRPALIIDFDERGKPTTRVAPKEKEGVDDCFVVSDKNQMRGRIWLAPDTFEVLRIDQRLKGPFEVSGRVKNGRFFEATMERSESSTVYRPVTFADPDETLVLPSSIVSLFVQTGFRQREMTTFTDYRRFVADGRIVEEP